MLKIEDLDYNLPTELIADKPAPQRDDSRLLTISRNNSDIHEQSFPSVVDFLNSGDCVIFNNTKVLKARLIGEKTNGKTQEILLVEKADENGKLWKAMVKNSRKWKDGVPARFGDVTAYARERVEDGMRIIEFEREMTYEDIDRIGIIPLPPYIVKKREENNLPLYEESDEIRYQTVFAKYEGSVAAPTASLHFTEEIIGRLEEKGVHIGYVTLHVGPGTFKPMDDDIESFQIHREWIQVPEKTVRLIKDTKSSGHRVMAVGTTSTRALETMADKSGPGEFQAYEGYTQLFINPPYKFQVVDILLTNFHLPRSTLLLLVYAFGGTELLQKAYQFAINEKFRFYSYGDSMLIY